MANIKSQIKRNKTNEKARLRNRTVKSELKTYIRKVKAAVSTGDADAADKALQAASSTRLSPRASSTRTRLRTASPVSRSWSPAPPSDDARRRHPRLTA